MHRNLNPETEVSDQRTGPHTASCCQGAAGSSSVHQVLLLLVEPHLAAGGGSKQYVDSSCYEAVVAHLVVQVVDPLRVCTEGKHNNITDSKKVHISHKTEHVL